MQAEPQFTAQTSEPLRAVLSPTRPVSEPARSHEALRLGVVLAGSVALHVAGALALALLPAVSSHVVTDIREVEIELRSPPAIAAEPPPVVAPEPPPEPSRVEPRRVEQARVLPREVAPVEPSPVPEPPVEAPPAPVEAPALVASAGLPSLDEAFGPGAPGVPALMGGGAGAPQVSGSGGGGGRAAPRSVSPPGPTADEVRRARRAYVATIEGLLRAQTRYPRAARREGHQGRVELALRVARDGRLLGVRIASSSGFDELDDAALDAAERLSPPPPPELVRWGAAEEVRAPVLYVLQ